MQILLLLSAILAALSGAGLNARAGQAPVAASAARATDVASPAAARATAALPFVVVAQDPRRLGFPAVRPFALPVFAAVLTDRLRE